MRLFLLLSYISFFFGIKAQNECGPPSGYTGTLSEIYPDGRKKQENAYLNGVKHGICLSFYLDGRVRSKERYRLGKLVETLQKPDEAHDQRDNQSLYRSPVKYVRQISVPQKNSVPDKWTSTHTKLNDSTLYIKAYWNNELAIEKKMVNGDLRYERQYQVKDELASAHGYDNINCEVNGYYKNNIYGRVTSWNNNGNISYQKEYRNNDPIGIHYTFYNDARHQVKTITHYTDPESMQGEPTSEIGAIAKNYDSLGKYTGYEVMYGRFKGLFYQTGRALKRVTFTGAGKVHTWTVKSFYTENVGIKGFFEDGYYKISNISTKNKKSLVKKGHGKYDGRYIPIGDIVFQIHDTVTPPKEFGTHTEWIIPEPEEALVPEPEEYFLGYENCINDRKMFSVPHPRCKGNIMDGFLTGEWEIDGDLFISSGIEVHVSSRGSFEKSRRTGVWIYENDFYRFSVNYVDGKKQGLLKAERKNCDMRRFIDTAANKIYRSNCGGSPIPAFGLPEIYGNLLSLWVGSYVNNEMHGEWLVYYRFPDLLAFKAIFNRGVLVAKTEEYNLKQQLVAKRRIDGNKVVEEKLYTPLGEEYHKQKYADPKSQIISLAEKNAKDVLHGKYMIWNNYTGHVEKTGTYSNGRKNGKWCYFSEGDTLIENFKQDTLDGLYRYNNQIDDKYRILMTGFYSKGEKVGLWKYDHTRDSLFREEIFMDDEHYLITQISKSKVCIKSGEGIIRHTDVNLELSIDEHYKDGKLFKTIVYYTSTNQVASIVFNTIHGDSLAYYMPPESGACVKNGTGMRTYFNENKLINKIEYYVEGKLLKYDRYSDGKFEKTVYFHFVSDTTVRAKNDFFVEKDVIRSEKEHRFQISLKVKNIPENARVIYLNLDEGFSVNELKISISESFKISAMNEKTLVLAPKKLPWPHEITIRYHIGDWQELSNATSLVLYTNTTQQFSISPYLPVKK